MVNSLYPSLLGAIGVIGWIPAAHQEEESSLFRRIVWFAAGYVTLVMLRLVSGRTQWYWSLLLLGSLWIAYETVIALKGRVWISIITAYVLTFVHLQVLSWYPFDSWRGIPTPYLIGVVWFVVAISAGSDPRQKLLVLCLGFLLTARFETGSSGLSSDILLCDGFWLAFGLLSLLMRLQSKVQSRSGPIKAEM